MPRGTPIPRVTATNPIKSPPMVCSFQSAPDPRFITREPLSVEDTKHSEEKFQSQDASNSGLMLCLMERPIVGSSVDFADLHAPVNRKRGITNRRTCGGRSMARGDGEFSSRTLDRIGVTVPLRLRQCQGLRRNKLVHWCAMAVQGDVAAFCLCNLQEI